MRNQRIDVEIDRSRRCPLPHPTEAQLEELGGEYVCGACENSGVIAPDVDRDEAGRLHAEPLPPGHSALDHEQWSPSYGGAGPRR